MGNNTKQTVAINGHSFSIELVAKALGIHEPITSFQVRQPIPDGYLRADIVSPKPSTPGIDLVLEKGDLRLALARVEQDELTNEDPVMAALYARNGDLMAFMAADTRTDDVVADEGAMDTLIAANFCEVSYMNDYIGTVPEPSAFVAELGDPVPAEEVLNTQHTEPAINNDSEPEPSSFLRLNDRQFSLQKIADMFGMEEPLRTIRLCQQLPSGVLSADLDPYQLDYPGIDLVMEVCARNGTDEFMVARCEQDAENDGVQPVKAYLYARCGDYIATKELDIRNHDDFEDGEKRPESLVVGGGYAIGPLDVYYEDSRFINLKGQYIGPKNS